MTLRAYVSLLLGAVVATVSLGSVATAQSESCTSNDNEILYSSVVSVPKGTYSLHLKLGRKGQSSTATVSRETIGEVSNCSTIGNVSATDSAWVAVGLHTVENSDSQDIFNVSVADSQATQDASAPVLLFVPQDSVACPDLNNCTVSYQGATFTQIPRKISFNSDTLRTALLDPVTSTNTIKKSIFYSDNKILYTSTDGSTKINKNYVSSGDHTLKTSLIMDNGQVLSSSEQVDVPFEITNFVLPYVLKNSSTLIGVGAIVGLLILYGMVLSVVRRIVKKYRWKKTHVASVSIASAEATLSNTEMYNKLLQLESKHKETKLFLAAMCVPVIVLMLYIVTNSFVLGRFTVDGVSMETTLHNGTTQWLYKLPMTIADLNKGAVSLKRGDVAVFRHDDNNLLETGVEVEKSYVVKRVIGLPGERVRVADGLVTVFNKVSPKGFEPDSGASWQSVVLPSDGRFIDITLKEGELFVVGDNRVDSIDSRNYGPVRSDDAVGHVKYKVDTTKKPFDSSLSDI